MRPTLSRSLLIFTLLVMAVMSWQWIEDRNMEPLATNRTIEMVDTQSDYYLENFEIKNISNKSQTYLPGNVATENTVEHNAGMPADRLLTIAGQSLSHHFIEGYSVIESPIIKLRSIDNGQWLASATTGTVSANFDVLNLQGNVELIHNRPQSTAPVTVDTNSISIDTSNRTIISREPVQVNGEGWQYNASSMDARIDQGILSFTSGVEAQFESPDKR